MLRTPARLGAPAAGRRAPASGRGRGSRAAAGGLAVALLLLAACSGGTASMPSVRVVPGMPSVADAHNLYREIRAGQLSPATRGARFRVYVPNLKSNDIYVIDPKTLQVVDRYSSGGIDPQHVVPSYDLKTLWIANEDVPGSAGTVVPIDPRTGKPGAPIAVDNPYNLYFTPDGRSVIVVAEQRKRLDFLDPHTFAFQATLPLPGCAGVNHGDFSIDGSYLILSCEFERGLVKVDWRRHAVLSYLQIAPDAVPQDVRVSPDGATFYVADLQRGGLYTVDGNRFVVTGFIPTTIGAHGLVVSRDGTKLYVANRGSQTQGVGPSRGPGSVSVLDFATNRIVATWSIPGGGSPDMGNVTPDGRLLFLSGRFDDVVYVFDTKTGAERTIPVGREPHGVSVWPQPGRYSLGHTGNMR